MSTPTSADLRHELLPDQRFGVCLHCGNAVTSWAICPVRVDAALAALAAERDAANKRAESLHRRAQKAEGLLDRIESIVRLRQNRERLRLLREAPTLDRVWAFVAAVARANKAVEAERDAAVDVLRRTALLDFMADDLRAEVAAILKEDE